MARPPIAWMTRHIRDFSKGYELAGIKLELRVTSRPERANAARPRVT